MKCLSSLLGKGTLMCDRHGFWGACAILSGVRDLTLLSLRGYMEFAGFRATITSESPGQGRM